MKHILLWVVAKKIKLKKIENSLRFPPPTLKRSHVQGFSAQRGPLPACRPLGQFLPQLQGHGKDPGQRVHPGRWWPAQQGHQWAEQKEHWRRHCLGYRQAGQRVRGQSPGSLRPAATEEEEESHDHMGFGLFDSSSALLQIKPFLC